MMSHDLKIAVVNFSGNVGKSLVARHLLAPRIPMVKIVGVETINSDGAGEVIVKGGDFGRLQESLMLEESVIIDVGASNIEQFLALMRMHRGSHQDFDLFYVPTVPDVKQQKDTIECIRALAEMQVPAEKIWLIFNMVDPGRSLAEQFDSVLRFSDRFQLCNYNIHATVYQSNFFARLSGVATSIDEILSDQTDFKSLAKDKSLPLADRALYAEKLTTRRLALGVRENLDAVFDALFS